MSSNFLLQALNNVHLQGVVHAYRTSSTLPLALCFSSKGFHDDGSRNPVIDTTPSLIPISPTPVCDSSSTGDWPSASSSPLLLGPRSDSPYQPREMPTQFLGPPSPTRGAPYLTLPTLSRFLADFTLGFADGLTVPFALTAGLSSLGQTDTVIYTGMAEICAGSISICPRGGKSRQPLRGDGLVAAIPRTPRCASPWP
jgi:hypothetical protein